MTLSRKNKTLLIDKEAAYALELLKDGLLSPVESLMNEEQSRSVLKTGLINGKSFPFPFILAPAGKINAEVLASLTKGEEITILFEEKPFATLIVDEVFHVDPSERIKQIYGTDDTSHPGVMTTIKRLGSLAVSGEYTHLNESS
ncbi:MAG: sulfate adenylyltransferase, partial [Campylobacterota bacterium]|nr:sulfate adenylyltransferase [Campylobacterota bacterium]